MPQAENLCLSCGVAIPSFAPGGNCPRCLLKSPGDSPELFEQDSSFPEIPRYRLHQLLGEGGFGMVYRATQLEPVQREVALKVLKPGMNSSEVLARFEAERQALALMDHPHIARIHDAGETGDHRPFFAMELVEGLPLNEYCRKNQPNLEARLRLFLDACSAVTHAHQKGLIHRDLKPTNILVGDSLKVIDFGIAKATETILTNDTLLTGEAQMLGTPEYMSPEQADGGSLNLDTRTDVYSLGAVLYELISGTPPFIGKELRARGLAEILRIIREEDPPRPSTRLSTVSSISPATHRPKISTSEIKNDLDWIVMQALSKERDQRYDTVSGLADDVKHFLNHEPVTARPPSLSYRISKFVRKNRAASMAAVLILLSILSAAVIGTSMAIRAEKAREAEARERERADEATYEARRTFSNSDLLAAGNALERNQPGNAIAHLARALRSDPQNNTAAYKLLTTLANHNFPRPTRKPTYLKHRATELYLHQNGTRALATSARGQALLFEVKSGQTIAEINFPATGYTPSASNESLSHVALSTQQGPVHLYELPSGKQLTTFPLSDPILLRDMTLSPDGKTVYTATHDGKVCAWMVGRQSPLWTYQHSSRAICLDLSDNGDRLAIGFGDGFAAILETKEGNALIAKKCHQNLLSNIRLLPGGERFATASYDHSARVWKIEDGSPQTPALRHSEPIYHLATSRCGGRIATSSYDQSTRVWDAITGAPHGRTLMHDDHVYGADFSPDGSRLATYSRDRTVRLWDPYRGIPVSAPVHHTEAVGKVLFTHDGLHLITTSRDRDLNHWDIAPGSAHPLIFRHEDPVLSALFDCEEPTLLTLSQNEKARLFDLTTGTRKGLAIPLPGKFQLYAPRLNPRFCDSFTSARVRKLLTKNTFPLFATIDRSKASTFALNPALTRMIVGNTDGSVIYWDLENASLIHRSQLPEANLTCLDLEGNLALSGHTDGSVFLFDANTGEIIHKVGHSQKITSVILDAKHGHFATGSMDNSARVWNIQTGQGLSPFLFHTDKASPIGIVCRFSPDGSLLATGGSHDTTLRLWNTRDGSPHLRPLQHDEYLSAFAFSHDGKSIATGTPTYNSRADVHLWDVATGLPLSGPIRHRESIRWLHFSQDDRFLASSSSDGDVYVTACPTSLPNEYLPDLAEYLAYRKLDSNGAFVTPDFQRLPPPTPDHPWLNWLATPFRERSLAPGVAPEVKYPKPKRSFGALRDALVRQPMNKDLMLELSKSLRTSKWPRHQIEADYYEKFARKK